MGTLTDKITLNLDDDTEVNVNGFIAPFEYDSSDFYVEWDELANLRVSDISLPIAVFPRDFL